MLRIIIRNENKTTEIMDTFFLRFIMFNYISAFAMIRKDNCLENKWRKILIISERFIEIE